ncbi:hypothetical protein D3C76_846290 [compost metagenome]
MALRCKCVNCPSLPSTAKAAGRSAVPDRSRYCNCPSLPNSAGNWVIGTLLRFSRRRLGMRCTSAGIVVRLRELTVNVFTIGKSTGSGGNSSLKARGTCCNKKRDSQARITRTLAIQRVAFCSGLPALSTQACRVRSSNACSASKLETSGMIGTSLRIRCVRKRSAIVNVSFEAANSRETRASRRTRTGSRLNNPAPPPCGLSRRNCDVVGGDSQGRYTGMSSSTRARSRRVMASSASCCCSRSGSLRPRPSWLRWVSLKAYSTLR